MALTKKQIAIIHVAKAKTCMSDDAYRELLAGFKAVSSTQLTQGQFEQLMRHFSTLGFAWAGARRPRPPQSKQRLMAKIGAIRAELGLPEAYVDGMVAKMFKNADGQPVGSYRWLSADQLHRLVAALTYHQRRRAAR